MSCKKPTPVPPTGHAFRPVPEPEAWAAMDQKRIVDGIVATFEHAADAAASSTDTKDAEVTSEMMLYLAFISSSSVLAFLSGIEPYGGNSGARSLVLPLFSDIFGTTDSNQVPKPPAPEDLRGRICLDIFRRAYHVVRKTVFRYADEDAAALLPLDISGGPLSIGYSASIFIRRLSASAPVRRRRAEDPEFLFACLRIADKIYDNEEDLDAYRHAQDLVWFCIGETDKPRLARFQGDKVVIKVLKKIIDGSEAQLKKCPNDSLLSVGRA